VDDCRYEELRKLNIPTPCSLFVAWMRQCGQSAYWMVNGETMCDEHIQGMADMNSENEEFLQPALDDMASRKPMPEQEEADDIRIAVKCVTCNYVAEHTIFKKYLWKYRKNEDGTYTRASEIPKTCSKCDPNNPDVHYGDEWRQQ
jgi:hypothetical protein